MGQSGYSAVPLHEETGSALDAPPSSSPRQSLSRRAMKTVYMALLFVFALTVGFYAGHRHGSQGMQGRGGGGGGGGLAAGSSSGLLPAQALLPEIPVKEIKFDFPTAYEDTSIAGDKLWDALMPIGSGFIRVPNPRQYDMPASKAIENDPDDAEIYSLSALHQLHCLGVLRDVIKKYQNGDRSRFAGQGHEYHCIDYIRQSIMCAGDTTLDYAEVHAEDGARRGFSGANSTHQCRDWDAIVSWAEENRAGDKKGIA